MLAIKGWEIAGWHRGGTGSYENVYHHPRKNKTIKTGLDTNLLENRAYVILISQGKKGEVHRRTNFNDEKLRDSFAEGLMLRIEKQK